MADPTAVATFALAILTFLLAVATCAAVVVPVILKWLDDVRAARSARHSLFALLNGFEQSLRAQLREPAWSQAGGSDVAAAATLDRALLSAVSPDLAREIVEAVMLAQRSLNNEDIRKHSQRLQVFQTILDGARIAIDAVVKASEKIDLT